MPLSKTSSSIWGVVFCVCAALFYTVANICMRKVAALGAEPLWAVGNKEFVTVLAAAPWMLMRAARGMKVWPAPKEFLYIVLVGLAIQVIGNIGVQWSLGVVGLAVTIPASIGSSLIFGATFGVVLLKEKVSARSLFAIGLLIGSLAILGIGAKTASLNETSAAAPAVAPMASVALLAFFCSVTAGMTYALLSIVIRRSMTGTTPQSALVFLITFCGAASLWPISFYQHGLSVITSTTSQQYFWIYSAGIFNLLGFLSITKGLGLTTVVHGNSLNSSQVALAAIAGVVFFNEPLTAWLVAGAALTALGIMLIDRPASAVETPETPL